MSKGKPGRVLFWISIGCWCVGWLEALVFSSIRRESLYAKAAVFYWAAGAILGTIWLIRKLWVSGFRAAGRAIEEGKRSA